jgi:hypothetical protein
MSMRVGITVPVWLGMLLAMLVFDLDRPDDDKLGLADPLETAQFRGQVLKSRGRAAKRDDFHAQVVIEMHVHGGHHLAGMSVLHVEHFVGEPRFVMIENQREAGSDVRGVRGPGRRGQFLAQQLANGFAPRGDPTLFAMAIELRQQVRFE